MKAHPTMCYIRLVINIYNYHYKGLICGANRSAGFHGLLMQTCWVRISMCIRFSLQIRPVRRGGGSVANPPGTAPRASFEVTLVAILYTCQEMQYTDMLQTRAYQNAEQLEVQLEGGARILLIHLYE